MSRPRVALVCTEMLPVPPILGGAIQTYIDGVLPELRAEFDITVVGVEDAGLPAQEVLDGVRHLRVPRASTREEYCRAVARRLREHAWDLVEVFNRPAFVPTLAEAAPGTRFVLSVHNDMFRRGRLDPQLAHRCLGRVSAVVTISNYIRRRIRRQHPEYEAKLVPILSGVDLREFRPRHAYSPQQLHRARARIPGLEPGRPVVLNVCRLSRKKGPMQLLDAMEQVLETHPEAMLVMVGSRWYGSNDRDRYGDRVHARAQQLGGSVVMAGYVPYPRIADYFAASDIFVCASQWREPLARVHYEAMAAGLPIITTRRGGNGEVIEVEGNGIFAEPHRDPAAFAAAIRRLLDDAPLRAALGARGRQLAEERYGWSRVAAELRQVWRTSLQEAAT